MISFISSHFPNLFRQEQVLLLVHILQSLLYPCSRDLLAFFPTVHSTSRSQYIGEMVTGFKNRGTEDSHLLFHFERWVGLEPCKGKGSETVTVFVLRIGKQKYLPGCFQQPAIHKLGFHLKSTRIFFEDLVIFLKIFYVQ